jgi:VanZ family protein
LNRLFRPCRRPAAWLALWFAGLVLVAAASLLPAGDLPPAPFPGVDKLEHLVGHGALSAYAAMLFAPARARLAAAGGLLAFGIGIEAAQEVLTATRQADAADVLANAAGIALGQLVAFTRLSGLLAAIDARLHA